MRHHGHPHPQPLLLERSAEAGFQHYGIEWLEPIIDSTELNATDHAARVVERGDHDHGKIA
jgi:hypothetical protein